MLTLQTDLSSDQTVGVLVMDDWLGEWEMKCHLSVMHPQRVGAEKPEETSDGICLLF